MEVISETAEERINLSGDMDPSPSRLSSDLAAESPSSANIPSTTDSPDRDDQFSFSPNPNKDSETQSSVSLKSEEYRQLFRLPPDEVLVQDFNCAYQESILLQGHMYLFDHYICFYSNIFGFETKKIVPFHEITIVRRAKTAGIFPNAIEIFAGGRKYFFASFLSRDEAFKLINDGWLQHGNGSQANSEQQDLSSETSSPENGPLVIEKVNGSNNHSDKQNSIRRDEDVLDDSKRTSNVENDLSTIPLEIQDDNVEQDAEPIVNVDSSSSAKTVSWKIEDYAAPKIPECFAKVAETKFPMKVEEFFYLFFSDDAFNFAESFHRKCGDKEFRCSSWKPHDEFGHARDVSFQHPIKIYFGAKLGSCQEIQKFRVYKNSHLVIESSQEINDVPYGDYFRVEALWDVERYDNESKEGCILRVYINVAFSKKTVWKGKIVQSTLEECREAYEIWIGMAHDLLKQKNIEKQEEVGPTASSVQNVDVYTDREVKTGESSERLSNIDDQLRTVPRSCSLDANQQVGNLLEGNLISATNITSLLRESMKKFCSYLKSQNRVSLILVIAFAVIILMQVSILVLLNRPQHIHVVSPLDYMGGGIGERSAETTAWLEKRMHYVKDEMLMLEVRLDRMRREYALLKAQFKDLEHLRSSQ
ncbi:protein VASCULAR ASSOCIATED DEATH 1, chloroplastic isoform X1 [Pistacia vera]|uniref:protein VASCULAR ASSOCIATED DEATH 1, chloroplastic isoform X1 n=2 Tax=Pistacia vera TaxID=55513 RepID=UPI0012631069|nr:protein VASCULAR ASSOCIATED DEATH 1, chloroplastic isoform X1 [Pistacia vera]